MRIDPRQYDVAWDVSTYVERESQTHVYFNPAPEAPEHLDEAPEFLDEAAELREEEPGGPPPIADAPMPAAVRTFEVTDRFQIPAIAAAPPRPSPFRVERTQRRRMPRSMIGLGFAVVCVLVGIAM